MLRALRYTTSHLLELSRWHLLEYIDFITSTDCAHAALAAFGKQQLLHQVHFAVLCHGNTDEPHARSLVEEAASALGGRALGLSQLPVPRLLQLPQNAELICRLHPSGFAPRHQPLLNADERNSAVELTLQAGLDERPASLYLELLTQILSHPAYERLRTTEQLGYIVNLGQRYDVHTRGWHRLPPSAVPRG